MFRLPATVAISRFGELVGRGAARVLDFRLGGEAGQGGAPRVLVTCEHAGSALPLGYSWNARDEQRVAQTHWAYDPGAAEFASELASALQGVAVLSTFSRLLVDVNRPLASPTLIRRDCGDHTVELNEFIGVQEIDRRVAEFYVPFHLTLNAVAAEVQPDLILSVHSFTQHYDGQAARDFEIGVLCSHDEDLAGHFLDTFEAAGFPSRLNEPYSGKEGIMHSPESLAGPLEGGGRVPAIMFEFRNDRCTAQEWRARAIDQIAHVVSSRTRTGAEEEGEGGGDGE
uniref:N-formylglutamate amidohydrolase n=1 Tax=Rhizochromulina marina TaxID=1034831 RepID=A0A7S2RSX3_9STRA|mmetsp:Transcript_20596/g.60154  ORF Transcript_20596/g.60154 Transcript_20596/m.60154 type:complete len:284 (+) Transcript_20596:115-966(+)